MVSVLASSAADQNRGLLKLVFVTSPLSINKHKNVMGSANEYDPNPPLLMIGSPTATHK